MWASAIWHWGLEVKDFCCVAEAMSSTSHGFDFLEGSRKRDFLQNSMSSDLIQQATHESYITQLIELKHANMLGQSSPFKTTELVMTYRRIIENSLGQFAGQLEEPGVLLWSAWRLIVFYFRPKATDKIPDNGGSTKLSSFHRH
jgi:hypothetical protein